MISDLFEFKYGSDELYIRGKHVHVNKRPLWSATILGQCYSQTNRRKGNHQKSDEALSFVESFGWQILQQKLTPVKPFEGLLKLECTIYYQSWRSDLDEQLVKNCLQKFHIIANDRQIRAHDSRAFVDPEQPRVDIRLWALSDDLEREFNRPMPKVKR
jgi:hypothetical protein